MSVLLDIQEALGENPDGFPDRVHNLNETVRLYVHPSPPLQVTFQIDPRKRVIQFLHFVAPQVSVTKPVFISYSRKDAVWLAKLSHEIPSTSV